MELRLLKVFCAVAEGRSLVVAAQRVHLTPSAISHSLKALETELGCRLFERIGKRMVLNQAGEQLLAQIRNPLAVLNAAADEIKRLAKWGQTRLRIGASAAACQHILPRVIRDLKKTYSSLDLRLESCDTPGLLDLIRKNRVDLALGIAPENSDELASRAIFRDELMFVFAPGHPWADGRAITRDDIRNQQFIVYENTSRTGQLLGDYFRELDIVPNTVMEIASIGAISELVRLNLGVSVLAPWTVSQELARKSLKMRPLGSKPLRRQWSAISLASRRLTFAEETFCRLCRNHTASLRLDRRDVPSAG